MKAEKVISKAKEHLILFHPFFSYLSLQFEFVPDNSVKMAETDGKSIFYNPEYIESISPRLCAGLIAHEICHILGFHHLRLEDKNFKQWNEACDYAINPILNESKIELPSNCLIDPKYYNMDAENIYELIKKEEDEKEDQQEEQEETKENEQCNADNESQNEYDGDKNAATDGETDQGNRENKEKDGGDGESTSEDGEEQPSDFGGIRQPPPDLNEREHETEITQMAVEASIQAEMAGEFSKELREVVENLKEPKQHWDEILREHVAVIAQNDYNWNRANTNYLQRGIYVPSLNNLVIGNIAFAIDSSCSINMKRLTEMFSEIKEAAEMFSEDLFVIQCDTEVTFAEEVSAEDIESIEVVGRGGTKFKPAFDYIEENDIEPKALVYLTDGLNPRYEVLTEPDYPVIWCIYDNPNYKQPFGEVIFIDN